jgi:ribosomal protein L40E
VTGFTAGTAILVNGHLGRGWLRTLPVEENASSVLDPITSYSQFVTWKALGLSGYATLTRGDQGVSRASSGYMAICPKCGEDNPERARLCMMCGTSLAQTQREQAEERKVVSVLFVDLVGFTARSHDLDPEDVRAALAPYHQRLKREIEGYGGTVEKFIGDAVMAVFGAPVAHEYDAERAVRAALQITDAIEELNEEANLGLPISAAVNTGEGLVTLSARPQQPELVTWRQGRSLPYGEGITFWALGEIVKAQAGISESDSPDVAKDKVTVALASLVVDKADRAWLRQRLAPLVGATSLGGTAEKEESFAAWLRFLEAIG